MHKFKPHKGLMKRVRVSAKGKPRRKMTFAGHLMSHKSGRRRQRLRKRPCLQGAFRLTVLRAMGLA